MTAIEGLDAAPERTCAAVVYRALRDDARFAFVRVAPGAGPYEVVHEDGEPDGAEGAALIDFFDVPAGEEEGFLAAWHEARAEAAGRRGYLGTRLYRDGGRFVHVARWSSPLMVSRALGPSHPALYLVVSA